MRDIRVSSLIHEFQSTLPVGGATHEGRCYFERMAISIHAPRGGSDRSARRPSPMRSNFNPRSPWGERPRAHGKGLTANHFNPRSPWGERRRQGAVPALLCRFQSTLPVGGATPNAAAAHSTAHISIHAPRGGSDTHESGATARQAHFNPRSPWGERQTCGIFKPASLRISIHAPRGGSDVQRRIETEIRKHFNPRSPWGERPFSAVLGANPAHFNPRSPWGERRAAWSTVARTRDFNPRSPWGERPHRPRPASRGVQFQSTLPVGGATRCSTVTVSLPNDFNPRSPWGERPGRTPPPASRLISIHAPRGGSDVLFRLRRPF